MNDKRSDQLIFDKDMIIPIKSAEYYKLIHIRKRLQVNYNVDRGNKFHHS